MNNQIRYAGYSLVGVSIAITLLLAYPEVNRSRAKARAVVPATDLRAATTDTVPGKVTLSDIMKKAPPLHISVKSATLHFNQNGECPGELLIGSADWMKGYPDNELVPGDPSPLATLPSGVPTSVLGGLLAKPCGDCNINVETVVNNWLKGAEHGGYANYGFVFKGMTEADLQYDNAASCYSRYGNFSLTVSYTYDTPTTYPLECRGIDTFTVLDLDGSTGSKWVGFTFKPGTKPASLGLLPGQCSWKDRGMRPGEPARLAIESVGDWSKELNSSDSFWTFNVYNAGAQLQATGAERTKTFFLPLLGTNYALAANGGVATALSTFPGSDPSNVINGDRIGFGKGGNWASATKGFPTWLEVAFSGSKTITKINVFTQQDFVTSPVEPTEKTTFSGAGLTRFDVQYCSANCDTTAPTWTTIDPGGRVGLGKFAPSPNDKVWVQLTFPAITTSKIRILCLGSIDGYSRIAEVEAWSK